ncbi:MAG: NAD(+) diphosphatase [Gammaproteobacteria bacterium]
MTLKTFFSGGQLDRAAESRKQPEFLQQAWSNPASRFIAIWQSRCMVQSDEIVLLANTELGGQWQPEDGIYLGCTGETHFFAVELPEQLHPDGPQEQAFDNFRALMNSYSEDDAALLAYAKGMLEWRKRHQHCGVCGAPNKAIHGGFIMECSIPECDSRSFPRLDPAIIVLTTHEDRCLLGRQVSWPEHRYSTIAGFVEPGESLEDAVVREVHEEANIRVGTSRYLGSQPWPFPNAIMLGFHAEATSTDIILNDGELADARWFSRAELTSGKVAIPPPQSIAFRLIEHWFDQWGGDPLQSFNISTDFRK